MFKDRQKHGADVDIKSVEQFADHIIENNGTLEQFIAKLASVVLEAQA